QILGIGVRATNMLSAELYSKLTQSSASRNSRRIPKPASRYASRILLASSDRRIACHITATAGLTRAETNSRRTTHFDGSTARELTPNCKGGSRRPFGEL